MKHHLLLTQLDCTHQLVGREIEVLHYRTPCRTFLTLVAEKGSLAPFLANGFSQLCAQYCLHRYDPCDAERMARSAQVFVAFRSKLFALCALLYALCVLRVVVWAKGLLSWQSQRLFPPTRS